MNNKNIFLAKSFLLKGCAVSLAQSLKIRLKRLIVNFGINGWLSNRLGTALINFFNLSEE